MAYGTIKVDTITFTDAGIDKSVTISGLVQNPTFTGNVTVTGTVSGATANFVSGVFTTQISGATVTGGNANFTSGTFTNISGGVYTITSGVFALGTSGTPSISFASDPNTGIYSPGADQVAISTNGTGRLFVDASGNVRIASGSAWATSDATFQLGFNSNEAFATTYFDAHSITVGAGTSYKNKIRISGTGADNNITFHVGASSPNEKMCLTSDGRLGLGTSSPDARLDVRDGDIYLYKGIGYGASADINYIIGTFNEAVNNNAAYQYRLNLAGNENGQNFSIIAKRRSTTDLTCLTVNGTSGNVGIGTTGPSYALDVINSGTYQLRLASSTSNYAEGGLYLGAAGTGDPYYYGYVRWNQSTTTLDLAAQDGTGAGGLRFLTNGGSTSPTERARIDVTGRLLVGTFTARANFNNSTLAPRLQVEGTDASTGGLSVVRNESSNGPIIFLGSSGGTAVGSNTIIANDTTSSTFGSIFFSGSDGTEFVTAASITSFLDGPPGANDMPGRLVFSTTADGASSPTERMRISSGGAIYQNFASRRDTSNDFSQLTSTSPSLPHLELYASNGSFANSVLNLIANRAANNAYSFLYAFSDNAADLEFSLYGDGNGKCDGAWTGGGADYAEYFEWSDGNPDEEDRRGISVVLDGDQIRPAVAGEDPIGVISGNPSVVGDAAWNKWSGKYLRDEYGTYILEDYEVEDEDGNTVIQQRRKLNSAYDPDQEYTSREERPEWDCVGLMGKLRMRKGQPTGSRWIKMRDISDSVEEWLVR